MYAIKNTKTGRLLCLSMEARVDYKYQYDDNKYAVVNFTVENSDCGAEVVYVTDDKKVLERVLAGETVEYFLDVGSLRLGHHVVAADCEIVEFGV